MDLDQSCGLRRLRDISTSSVNEKEFVQSFILEHKDVQLSKVSETLFSLQNWKSCDLCSESQHVCDTQNDTVLLYFVTIENLQQLH